MKTHSPSDIEFTEIASPSLLPNQSLSAASFKAVNNVDYVQLALEAAEKGNLSFLRALIDPRASYADKLAEASEWQQIWKEAGLFCELEKTCLQKIDAHIQSQIRAPSPYSYKSLLEEKKDATIATLLNDFQSQCTRYLEDSTQYFYLGATYELDQEEVKSEVMKNLMTRACTVIEGCYTSQLTNLREEATVEEGNILRELLKKAVSDSNEELQQIEKHQKYGLEQKKKLKTNLDNTLDGRVNNIATLHASHTNNLSCSLGLEEIKKALPELHISINVQDPTTGDSLLHRAIIGMRPDVILYLLDNGIDPALVNQRGETPIMLSAELLKQKNSRPVLHLEKILTAMRKKDPAKQQVSECPDVWGQTLKQGLADIKAHLESQSQALERRYKDYVSISRWSRFKEFCRIGDLAYLLRRHAEAMGTYWRAITAYDVSFLQTHFPRSDKKGYRILKKRRLIREDRTLIQGEQEHKRMLYSRRQSWQVCNQSLSYLAEVNERCKAAEKNAAQSAKEAKTSRETCEKIKNDLTLKNNELEEGRKEIEEKHKEELAEVRASHESTEKKLDGTEKKLEDTEKKLEDTEKRLEVTEKELAAVKAESRVSQDAMKAELAAMTQKIAELSEFMRAFQGMAASSALGLSRLTEASSRHRLENNVGSVAAISDDFSDMSPRSTLAERSSDSSVMGRLRAVLISNDSSSCASPRSVGGSVSESDGFTEEDSVRDSRGSSRRSSFFQVPVEVSESAGVELTLRQ